MKNSTLILNGQSIEVDNEGFLLDPEDWSKLLAEEIASQLELPLNEERYDYFPIAC